MTKSEPRYPYRVRWWEDSISYSATKDESGWRFYEKEAQTVQWFETSSTSQLVARAEAALSEGRHVEELSGPQIREVRFYSCFISYSTADQPFAERLYADLQTNGVRCWFAPHNMAGGKPINEQIDEAIRLYDRLLLILSPSSIDSSWVKAEILKARAREVNERRRVLFPLRLVEFAALLKWECFDSDTGTDCARTIREYFIPDFSKWKSKDDYKRALQRLLQDLADRLEPNLQSDGT
jgi:hypothetical protein